MRMVAITLALILAPALEGVASASETVAAPQQVIADLAADLFSTLDQQPAAIRHNADKVLPVIDHLLAAHFDTLYTARLVLGQHWNSASPEQRQQFAAAFYQRLLRTYVGAVAEWSAKRFKLLPQHSDAAALQVTVLTQVWSASGAVVPVDYRMRQSPEGWKIFDVIVEGVSYVRSYHDDIDADVAQNGLAAATARLAWRDTGAAAHPASEPHHPQ